MIKRRGVRASLINDNVDLINQFVMFSHKLHHSKEPIRNDQPD